MGDELIYLWVDPNTMSTPTRGVHNIHIDSWWLTNERGEIAFYQGRGKRRRPTYSMPQCNTDRRVAELVAKGRPVKQIPMVYVPVDMSEY